jgi:hypothetical protein
MTLYGADISGDIEGLRLYGVEIEPLVQAELDRHRDARRDRDLLEGLGAKEKRRTDRPDRPGRTAQVPAVCDAIQLDDSVKVGKMTTELRKAKLSARQKMVIAGLLCLQVPSSAIFYPAATVIILTGVGAPLSMVFWEIGTMPFSLAMKRKAAWQSRAE